MRIALYTRVSTNDQSPENQERELQAWADREGHNIIARYSDVMSGARRREFDVVAIWSLDRLSREGPLATLLYIQRLNAMGVKVYSHQEPYLNPSLPFYESIIALLADIAKWERVRLSDRTKAGMRRAAREGKQMGRPKGSKDRQKRVVRPRIYRRKYGIGS